jgi:hypothetical protein
MSNIVTQEKDLRVYWIRNIPNKAKFWPVRTIENGLNLLLELSNKDLNDKSIFSNTGGLQIYISSDKNNDDNWMDLPTDYGDRNELETTLRDLGIPVSAEALN